MTSKAPSETASLTGTLLSITFRNEDNGWTIARLEIEGHERPVAIVGRMPGVQEGDALAVEGHWTTHPTYGRQVEVQRCEIRPPSGRRGLLRFLGGGRFKGIGPATAERIVDALGLELLEKLERDPGALHRVPNLKRAVAASLLEQLALQREATSALVFLQEHGLGPTQALRVFQRYGARTVELVRSNPYRLADEVAGVGFRIADAFARQLGLEEDSAFRVAAGLTYLLGQAALEGHVGLPVELLVGKTAPFLQVDEVRVEQVLAEALADGRLVEDGLVYRPELLRAEREVAERLLALLERTTDDVGGFDPGSAIARAEKRARISLSDDQRAALELLLASPVAVLTGGPGVGKTTIVRLLVEILREQQLSVALAAPTGRAARRLSEATGADASTLHRLLGLLPGRDTQPVQMVAADVLVVDETSMVDLALMAATLAALPSQGRLVLVGDADQLPSVGPGEVLRDVIQSRRVPVARLGTIFRQAGDSGIVRVAHEINAGRAPEFDEGPQGQAFFVEREDAAGMAEAVRALVVERIPARFGLDPRDDVQVLTPMHGGPLGTVALNEALREALNPAAKGRAEIERFGRLFRAGDKVMQVKNDYDRGVFNGDVGRVLGIDEEEGRVVVVVDGRKVEYGLDDLDELEPAFAITCHKSQGSEFPAVVLVLSSAHTIMLRRNLVYTAVTRAKRVLVAVGDRRALQTAVFTPGAGGRYGRLGERLAET